MESPVKSGILVMAYGTPAGLEDVERYYTDIRHGKPPPPELLEELTERYRAIGGRSPLLELTRAQARGIGERVGLKAYIGQKHSPPFIPDAIRQLADDGVDRAIGIVLAPHYSAMSIGDYTRRAQRAAREHGWEGSLQIVESWHLEPGYVSWLAARVKEALADLAPLDPDDVLVIFSAHSLPVKILASGDPYADQLEETARAVAAEAGLRDWRVGWQSAGRTEQEWLGPDLLEILDEASGHHRGVIVCSAGFVADHLEVLYDVDIEARAKAADVGISLQRTRSPNDDPYFLDTLAGIIRRHL